MSISIDGTTATLTFDDYGYCSVTKTESNCCCNTSTSTNLNYDDLLATSASTVSNSYARPTHDSISTTIDTKVDKCEFDTEINKINNKIKKLESEPVYKNTSHLEDLIATDWRTMYNTLTKENKSIFWRTFIDKIEIDPLNYKKGGKYIKVILL